MCLFCISEAQIYPNFIILDKEYLEYKHKISLPNNLQIKWDVWCDNSRYVCEACRNHPY